MERARTGSHDGAGAQADAARPAARAIEGLLAFQRAAGNRATGRLLRTFHHGTRAIGIMPLAAIEKKLRAELGTAFPESSWNVSSTELAAALGVSPSAAAVRLHRARTRLRAALAHEEDRR